MDANELDRCMRKYYKCVYGMAFCYCKNPSDADDIAQDVFLKLFTYDGTFLNDEQLKAWLLKCAVNRSINVIKSCWYRLSRPLEAAGEITGSGANMNDDTMLPIIMKLNKNNRTALYLYYYERFSVDEIARITNISGAAVRSRLARGRRQLKKMLGNRIP